MTPATRTTGRPAPATPATGPGGRGAPPEPCQVSAGFVAGLSHGDWVTVHWDRVCDRLSQAQLLALRRYTARHIHLANTASGKSAATQKGVYASYI